jgi:hypothetical protein
MLQIGGGLRNEMKINYEFHNIRCDWWNNKDISPLGVDKLPWNDLTMV